MGKINKYSNLYDKNGKIIRKVNSNGILKNVTIPELEELIDKYDGDKNDCELDNMKMMLFRMYNTYGNPHEKELIERIKAEAAKKTSSEEVKEKLEELNKDVEEKYDEYELVA
jgi:predicted transcriptional regulator